MTRHQYRIKKLAGLYASFESEQQMIRDGEFGLIYEDDDTLQQMLQDIDEFKLRMQFAIKKTIEEIKSLKRLSS